MSNPYRLGEHELPAIVHFSGGRTSAYMLWHMLDAYDGVLPDDIRVAFANTGKERPKTLDFVQECSERWDVDVTWLEYVHRPEAAGGIRDPRHVHRVVDRASAALNGEPFEALIQAKAMLPNVAQRMCTDRLKVCPVKWWVRRELGWPDHRSVLGIRHDEPRRWKKALMTECHSLFPLVHAEVEIADVTAFWRDQPFDLGIPSDEGNCDLCFLKGADKLRRIIRAHPEWVDWWIEMDTTLPKNERWLKRRLRDPSMARFSKRWTYQQLKDEALRQPELPLHGDDTPQLVGEEPTLDCFCGTD